MSSPPFSLATVRAVQAQVVAATADLAKHIKKSNAAGARVALQQGADIDQLGRSGNGKRGTTVLHEAIRRNQPELLAVLLEHGAPPDAVDGSRLTPLMFAAKANRAWAIAPLLAAGADPNAVERQNGETALALALEHANDDALEALLANPRTDAHATPGLVKMPYLFRAQTARAVHALVAAGIDPHAYWATSGEVWAAPDWLMVCGCRPSHAQPHTLKVGVPGMGGFAIPGLVEMGLVDPAPALQALLAAGCSVSNTTLILAAQKALPRCLVVLDAQGLDWFVPMGRGQARTAMDELHREDPALAAHWSNVLRSRATAQSLERQLPTAPVQRPPRM